LQRKEKKHERNCCRRVLHDFGVPNVKLMHPGGETGWPDRQYFIEGGKPFLVEWKEKGYTPELRQEYIHDMLRGLGYDVSWFDNEEEGYQAIRARVEAARNSKARRKVSR